MNDLVDFVDKTCCINLDVRKDRWELVSEEFTRVGIRNSVERFSAIANKDPRRGCLESHLQCIRDAQRDNLDNLLIFEDDVCFSTEINRNYSEVIDFLKTNDSWELFYLGGNVMYPARFVNEHVFWSRFFSTHAYVINRRAFAKVFEAQIPIDEWYAWNTNSYGLYPIIALQNETYSDIRQAVVENRGAIFTRSYDLLVKPNYLMRWVNYFKTHYLG